MTDDDVDDKLDKIESIQERTQKLLDGLQPVSKELIDGALELLSKPREQTQPGDPGYEIDQMINRCMMCKRDKRDKTTDPCSYCKPKPKYPRMAGDGEIFVCGACGKTSKDLYGEEGDDGGYSWDESCMLNAVLCIEESIVAENGRIVKADAVKGYE